MIPRNRPTLVPSAPQDVAERCPPIAHRVTDLDLCYGPSANDLVQLTLSEHDVLDEQPDRFVVTRATGERIELFKAGLRWTGKRERTFTTPAPILTPPDAA